MNALLPRCICAFLLIASPLRAADFAAAFLQSGIGARALGMGGAASAVASGPAAAYWNPAGLARTKGKGLQTSMQSLALDRRISSASFALNPRGDMGFGLAWLHASVGDIDGRTASGQRTGSVEDAANAFLISVGRTLGPALSIGFSMKIFDQRIEAPFSDAATANGHGFDLGIQYALSQRTTVALSARNLSAALNWKVRLTNGQSSSTKDALPRTLAVGAAHRPFDGAVLAVEVERGDETTGHMGAEWTLSPLLSLRGGLRHIGGEEDIGLLAAGLSLRPMRSQKLQFHYAYAADPLDAGGRTTIGLEVAF